MELSSKSCTILSFLVFISVKFARDPSNFYAAKLHNSLESGDMDTAGRIILTSTVVRLVFSCRTNPTPCVVDE